MLDVDVDQGRHMEREGLVGDQQKEDQQDHERSRSRSDYKVKIIVVETDHHINHQHTNHLLTSICGKGLKRWSCQGTPGQVELGQGAATEQEKATRLG